MSGQDDHRNYLDSKVNPVLQHLVTALLVTRPEQPVPFMVKWLRREYNVQDENDELQRLRQELAALRGVSQTGIPARNSEVNLSEESDDEDEEDLAPQRKAKENHRKAVSSEAYGKWNRKEAFVPRVIEKNPDQRGRILDKIGSASVHDAGQARGLCQAFACVEQRQSPCVDAG